MTEKYVDRSHSMDVLCKYLEWEKFIDSYVAFDFLCFGSVWLFERLVAAKMVVSLCYVNPSVGACVIYCFERFGRTDHR